MPHLTLDAHTAALFTAVTGHVELRDAQGKVIGYFRPRIDHTIPAISEEELDRREKEPGRRLTTDEVIELARRRAATGVP